MMSSQLHRHHTKPSSRKKRFMQQRRLRSEYFVSNANNSTGMVMPSPLPYQRHYAKILPKVSKLFRKGRDCHFVDVGSAPGGLCHYLIKDLKWSGRAFSLSEREGGFKMMYGGGERLKFTRFDVGMPDSWRLYLANWKRKPRVIYISSSILSTWVLHFNSSHLHHPMKMSQHNRTARSKPITFLLRILFLLLVTID